jgi:CheY-like chemotaxis protein
MSTNRPVYDVFLVEDDDTLAACAVRYLVQRGLLVDSVRNLEQALNRLSSVAYDAVVTDLDLTGTGRPDGLAVVPAAARAQPRPTVIVWSGSVSSSVLDEARRLGADAVLGKGALAELAHALATHLGTPRTLDATGSAQPGPEDGS